MKPPFSNNSNSEKRRILSKNNRAVMLLLLLASVLFSCTNEGTSGNADIEGALMKWHPLSITFEGPEVTEAGTPNPFRDYRLNVTFTHNETGSTVTVPGYFAADGDAGETGAIAGNKWQARFTPHHTGTWNYTASFRTGTDVAINLAADAGSSDSFDGTTSTFAIVETDKTGRDHRGKGVLRYVGERYLRFDDGSYFIKGGADSPENLLAYVDFDDTFSLLEKGQEREGKHPQLRCITTLHTPATGRPAILPGKMAKGSR